MYVEDRAHLENFIGVILEEKRCDPEELKDELSRMVYWQVQIMKEIDEDANT